MTGRKAIKKSRSNDGSEYELYEIKLVDSEDECWSKWVKLSDLSEISSF